MNTKKSEHLVCEKEKLNLAKVEKLLMNKIDTVNVRLYTLVKEVGDIKINNKTATSEN
ncbi:hypothetical protein [Vibrio metschnikovii]|uniref:hypothetical protein n=1 Tax=Vibrio metschnikovii TaxID=28172 RepID=UPI001C2FED72|nr:hypothetical protein [Vibrio metschnikovii]